MNTGPPHPPILPQSLLTWGKPGPGLGPCGTVGDKAAGCSPFPGDPHPPQASRAAMPSHSSGVSLERDSTLAPWTWRVSRVGPVLHLVTERQHPNRQGAVGGLPADLGLGCATGWATMIVPALPSGGSISGKHITVRFNFQLLRKQVA